MEYFIAFLGSGVVLAFVNYWLAQRRERAANIKQIREKVSTLYDTVHKHSFDADKFNVDLSALCIQLDLNGYNKAADVIRREIGKWQLNTLVDTTFIKQALFDLLQELK